MPRDERKELPLRGQESWTRRDIGLISTARLHCRRAPRTPGIYRPGLRVVFYSYKCQKLLNRGRINHNQPCKIKITYFKTHCSENGKAVTTVAQTGRNTGRNAGRRRGGELCRGGGEAVYKARHKCQLRAAETARANSGQERDARECSGRRNKSKQQQHGGGLNPTLPTSKAGCQTGLN